VKLLCNCIILQDGDLFKLVPSHATNFIPARLGVLVSSLTALSFWRVRSSFSAAGVDLAIPITRSADIGGSQVHPLIRTVRLWFVPDAVSVCAPPPGEQRHADAERAVINQPSHTLDPERRPHRRLSDEILIAFHQACNQGETAVAGRLLSVLEFMMKRTPGRDRRAEDGLVAAHERLWPLRQPGLSEC
jgi:hypothetical protein